jgi:hypothetical protein
VDDWQTVAARLEEMDPLRWGPVGTLDDGSPSADANP